LIEIQKSRKIQDGKTVFSWLVLVYLIYGITLRASLAYLGVKSCLMFLIDVGQYLDKKITLKEIFLPF